MREREREETGDYRKGGDRGRRSKRKTERNAQIGEMRLNPLKRRQKVKRGRHEDTPRRTGKRAAQKRDEQRKLRRQRA